MHPRTAIFSVLLIPGLALAQIQVVGEGACPKFAADIESFATCDGDRVTAAAAATPLKIAALPSQQVAAHKRSDSGLYVSAAEAHRIRQAFPGQVVLVDIRSRVEVAYAGQPDPVDVHVPYLEPELPLRWNPASNTLKMQRSPAFVEQVRSALARLDGPTDPVILLLCRSGRNSAIAADALTAAGLMRVYTIVDGFEGDIGASGRRDVNGWKNAGGDWQAKPTARQVFASMN
jgi:rhodanese-related sulfurtransferase